MAFVLFQNEDKSFLNTNRYYVTAIETKATAFYKEIKGKQREVKSLQEVN